MRRHLAQGLSAACLGVAVSVLGNLASHARAAGLVGSFSPDKWDLNRYISGSLDSTFDGPSSYLCGQAAGSVATNISGTDVIPSCVSTLSPGNDTSPANFVINGSSVVVYPPSPPNPPDPNSNINATGASTIVEWSLLYNGTAPAKGRFNFSFTSNDDEGAVQAYFRVGQGPFVFDPFDPGAVSILTSKTTNLFDEKFTINPGDTIYYGVYTDSNTGGKIGTLTIDGFDVEPVPAPLPLLGAGAAFSWSRRLRSRLRRPAAGVTGD